MPIVGGFRVWCQKVLPLVYDDSLSYYEVLCAVTAKMADALDEAKDYTDTKFAEADAKLTAGLAAANAHTDQKFTEVNNRVSEVSDRLSNSLNAISDRVVALEEKWPEMQGQLGELLSDVNTLKEWVANFEWDRLYQMVADIIADYIPSQLSVGLNSDGYFVITAWKPWLGLVFNTTGYDITVDIQPEFGHLVVSY